MMIEFARSKGRYGLVSLILWAFFYFGHSRPVRAAELQMRFDDRESTVKYELTGDWQGWDWTFSPLVSSNEYDDMGLNLSEAYLTRSFPQFTLEIGRKKITYGPGRYGFPMLGPVGEGLAAQGYDQIGYSFAWDKFLFTKNFHYQKFYAYIPEADSRMLLGHRATTDWGRFTVGVSEAALVNQGAPWFYYLPVPFVPVYLYQYIGNELMKLDNNNETANIATEFDLTYHATDNVRIYLEYYMDDRPWPTLKSGFKAPDWDRWWWKVGYQAGVAWKNAFKNPQLTLYTEYTRVDQYTYTSYHPGGFDPNLNWTYKDRILGDPLGPDADRLNLELIWEQSPERQWNFAYKHTRHGAGKIGDQWYYQPGVTEVFLTGTVETGNALDVSLTRKYRNYEITFLLGAEHLDNAGNVTGASEFNPRLALWGTYRF
jgi:hypothetical protein